MVNRLVWYEVRTPRSDGPGMNAPNSAGGRFRAAWEQEHPLQAAGVINAYAARLVQATGFLGDCASFRTSSAVRAVDLVVA
jgi:2-methylisocitrate lyase-like PEP mutase family enzyme